MKNLKFLLAIIAFFFLLFTSCEKEMNIPAYNPYRRI
jgi:hypothetical protein